MESSIDGRDSSFSEDDDCCGLLDLDLELEDCDLLPPPIPPPPPRRRSEQRTNQEKMSHHRSIQQVTTEETHTSRRKDVDNTKEMATQQNTKQSKLLCIHICPHRDCNAETCQPPDLKSESLNREKFLKKPSFFYVPVEMVLTRDEEMRQAARTANIPESRWNGSLLYQKWKEHEHKQKKKNKRTKQSTISRDDDDDDDLVVITVHPVQELAQAHVISPKFPWWQSWLTICIRAYYNTGTLRIPKECHGLELLLALEYFGILYTSPEQLSFDAPDVYWRVKHWSRYFTHRAVLAQWIVHQLQTRMQERQLDSPGNENEVIFQEPYAFCTYPYEAKSQDTFSLTEVPDLLVKILDGGLITEEPEEKSKSNYTSLQKKAASLSSPELVHAFFVPNLERPSSGSSIEPDDDSQQSAPPEVMPAMMREDFSSYLQHVLPEMDISFKLQSLQVTSLRRSMLSQTIEESPYLLPSAVLFLTWNPSKAMEVEARKNDPPANEISVIQEDDKVDRVSTFTSTLSDTSEENNGTVVSVGATSISAAPTDEMAFGRLLNDTHKAVSRLLQHSAHEKAIGIRIGKENGFYFHQDDADKSETLNKTQETTTSSASTSSSANCSPQELNESLTISSSTASESKSARSEKKNIPEDNEATIRKTNEGREQRRNSESSTAKPRGRNRPEPSSLPFSADDPMQRGGSFTSGCHTANGYRSLQVDHIYADLHNDCIFPGSSLMAEQFNIPTTATNMSPLWTASLLRGESKDRINIPPSQPSGQKSAPLSCIHASAQDQMSITSSVTRSLRSSGTRNTNMQKAMQRSQAPHKTTSKDRSQASADISRRNSKPFTSSPHDAHFDAKLKTFLGDTASCKGSDSKTKQKENCRFHQKDKTKKSTSKRKKQSHASLLDEMDIGIGLDVSGIYHDLHGIQEEDEGAHDVHDRPTEESCQLLNDLYGFFIAEDKKPDIVIVPQSCEQISQGGLRRRSSLSSQSIGMESLSNQKHPNILEKKDGQSKERPPEKNVANNNGSFPFLSKTSCGDVGDTMSTTNMHNVNTKVASKKGAVSCTSAHMNNIATTTTSRQVQLPRISTETKAQCARINAINAFFLAGEKEDANDLEANNGIEVYHVPTKSREDGKGTTSLAYMSLFVDEDDLDFLHQEGEPRFRKFRQEGRESRNGSRLDPGKARRLRQVGRKHYKKKGLLGFLRRK